MKTEPFLLDLSKVDLSTLDSDSDRPAANMDVPQRIGLWRFCAGSLFFHAVAIFLLLKFSPSFQGTSIKESGSNHEVKPLQVPTIESYLVFTKATLETISTTLVESKMDSSDTAAADGIAAPEDDLQTHNERLSVSPDVSQEFDELEKPEKEKETATKEPIVHAAETDQHQAQMESKVTEKNDLDSEQVISNLVEFTERSSAASRYFEQQNQTAVEVLASDSLSLSKNSPISSSVTRSLNRQRQLREKPSLDSQGLDGVEEISVNNPHERIVALNGQCFLLRTNFFEASHSTGQDRGAEYWESTSCGTGKSNYQLFKDILNKNLNPAKD